MKNSNGRFSNNYLSESERPYLEVSYDGAGCNTQADTDCNGCVSLLEMVNLMLKYKQGQTTLSLIQMVNIMLQYKQGQISC